jgi:acetyl-CoA synthetase
MTGVLRLGPPWRGGVTPNVVDPDAARASFRWADAVAALDRLPDGGLNIAHETVDRHATGPRRDRVAMRWLHRDGSESAMTYEELAAATNRFANVLRDLDVAPGSTVFTLAGRIPDLYVAVLGTLKHGSVAAPLFSAFGPEPIRQRMTRGEAAVLVTTPQLYRRRVAGILDQLPTLRHVLVTGGGAIDRALPLEPLMAQASDRFEIAATRPDDIALLHFTSGTTGMPKGALHAHRAVIAHHATGRCALDLHDDDVFWCTADPGWVTGTSYGIIAPLSHGVTSIVDDAELDADAWYGVIERHRVSVWYTAPTALRMLMRAGTAAARRHDLSSLRVVASVGEPLNPEVVTWGLDAFGLPILDTWWQTETGGIMIANLPADDIVPGAMGRPLPGVKAGLLRRGPDGRAAITDGRVDPLPPDDDGVGELALRAGWPSMFCGYLHDEERSRRCFADGWYLTGDLARRDDAGRYHFVGRADDVIKSAGHLIGPTEVENVLLEHPAVVDAGVIGVPDPVAGEVVKAFVSVAADVVADDELALELIAHCRRRLGPAVAPRQIAFDQHLPTTKSGKIMRRLLRARELGLPEGDLSTLEVTP